MNNRNVFQSFRSASSGLLFALRTQRNARIQVLIAAAVVVLGLWLDLEAVEWAILALTIGFVLAAEMVNTVAESLVDLTCPDYDPRAKVVKDVTAGAVLLGAIFSVLVGLLVLGPSLWSRLFGL